jgi:apolipoprotein N-acyltransferase
MLSMKLPLILNRYAPLIQLLLGCLCVLGFAPFYLYPIPILSLIALIAYWRQCQTLKTAAQIGFTFGLGLFGTGIYWIYISLHDFGGMPALMAGMATFILCAFMAAFTATIGPAALWLSNKNTSKNHIHFVIAIACIWALTDWIRSWIFTGFPWLTMGYSQVPYSPLAGYVPLFGVYSISFMAVLIAGLISTLFIKPPPHSIASRRHIIVFLIFIWVSGSLLKLMEWTTPIGAPIRTALIQGNISQAVKWSPEHTLSTIKLYLDAVKKSTAELIILPETALPILSHQLDADLKSQLIEHARSNHGNIILGIVEYKADTEEYFNSALSFGTESTKVYQKSHLVPFGEFIPLKQLFGWIYRDWLNMPLSDLSRGNQYQSPMLLSNQKIAMNICYEDVFGEEIIRQLPEATLLVNISNDAWYGQSLAADQHMQFSQTRALETGRMMLRATNTGATAIIDPHGMVLAHAPHDVQTTLNGQAQGYTGATPYVKWGNWPFIILSFIIIALLWRRKNK